MAANMFLGLGCPRRALARDGRSRSRSPDPYRIVFRAALREDHSACTELMNRARRPLPVEVPLAIEDAPAAAHGLGQPVPAIADAPAPAHGLGQPVLALAPAPARGLGQPQQPQPEPPQPAYVYDSPGVPGFANEYGWPADRPWDHPDFRGPGGARVWASFHRSHVRRSYRSVGICIQCGYYMESSGPAPPRVAQPCLINRNSSGRSNLVRLRQGVHPRSNTDFLV